MSDLIRIVLAFLVWLAAFSAVYGLHGVGCAAGWSHLDVAGTSVFRMVLVAAALVAVLIQSAVLLVLNRPQLRSRSPFVAEVSTRLATAALIAQVWSLLPALALSACR